jgi:hypothetical protein
MKTLASATKFLIIFSVLNLSQLLVSAQTKLADLKDGSINKAITQSYRVRKTTSYVIIDNINNKFTNVKQNNPKYFGLILEKPDIVIDQAQLSKICAKYISKQQLEILASGIKYTGLRIEIKTNINGNTLEVGFLTDQNSVLTLVQLEEIEKEIKTTKLVNMKPEIVKLLEGSNFWQVSLKIYFEDILKVKQGMEGPQQREIH